MDDHVRYSESEKKKH